MVWLRLSRRSQGLQEGGFAPVPQDAPVDVFDRLEQSLRAEAQALSEPGDRLYVSLLLRALKNEGVEVPAMPRDMLEIQRILSTPASCAEELAQAVQRDLMVAGKFLAVANSPLYAPVHRIETVRDAIVRLGRHHAGIIVLAIAASATLFHVQGFESKADRMKEHALGTAIIAQALAPLGGFDPAEAFLAGLLHDIGRVFMLSMLSRVHRESRGQKTVRPESLERLLERLHADFSAVILRAWAYPESLVEAVADHHGPEAPSAEGLEPLSVLLSAADRMDKRPAFEALEPLAPFLAAVGISLDEASFLACQKARGAFLEELGLAR